MGAFDTELRYLAVGASCDDLVSQPSAGTVNTYSNKIPADAPVEFAASLGLGSLVNYVRGFKNLTALEQQHTRDMKLADKIKTKNEDKTKKENVKLKVPVEKSKSKVKE